MQSAVRRTTHLCTCRLSRHHSAWKCWHSHLCQWQVHSLGEPLSHHSALYASQRMLCSKMVSSTPMYTCLTDFALLTLRSTTGGPRLVCSAALGYLSFAELQFVSWLTGKRVQQRVHRGVPTYSASSASHLDLWPRSHWQLPVFRYTLLLLFEQCHALICIEFCAAKHLHAQAGICLIQAWQTGSYKTGAMFSKSVFGCKTLCCLLQPT